MHMHLTLEGMMTGTKSKHITRKLKYLAIVYLANAKKAIMYFYSMLTGTFPTSSWPSHQFPKVIAPAFMEDASAAWDNLIVSNVYIMVRSSFPWFLNI